MTISRHASEAMYSEGDLLALSGLQHLAYCERQWALIHLDQAWEDSTDTLRGDYFHERVDTAGYSSAGGVLAERRVRLTSYALGLYGVADIVERSVIDGKTVLVPIEYKVGRPKHKDWDRLQVAAQAMCLEEMYGVTVEAGCLFYGETRRREKVRIDEGIRGRVASMSLRMHELYESQQLPRAKYCALCKRCSLVDACMPSISSMDARDYWIQMGEGWPDA